MRSRSLAGARTHRAMAPLDSARDRRDDQFRCELKRGSVHSGVPARPARGIFMEVGDTEEKLEDSIARGNFARFVAAGQELRRDLSIVQQAIEGSRLDGQRLVAGGESGAGMVKRLVQKMVQAKDAAGKHGNHAVRTALDLADLRRRFSYLLSFPEGESESTCSRRGPQGNYEAMCPKCGVAKRTRAPQSRMGRRGSHTSGACGKRRSVALSQRDHN